jgi:glyceraldehyde 3-phosphate dehydrogenase
MGVGLIGFGRLARNLIRILRAAPDLEVRALADPAEAEALAYLLRFDSLLGRFPGEIALEGETLAVDGRAVRLARTTQAGQIPWRELGVDLVVVAQGSGLTRSDFAAHFAAGARRLLLCVPSKDAADATIVQAVNGAELAARHRVVSASSGTAQAVAPVLDALSRAFGIERAFLSVVHAYTDQDRLADVPASDMRLGRAAAENIIPRVSDAAHVLDHLLPALAGRLSAAGINVPVADGSAVDLVCWHEKEVTVESINEALRAAAVGPYRGVLAYEDQPIVSSDVLGLEVSGVFDADATMVLGGRASKTLTWFDNGWGYAHRAIELLRRLAEFERGEA